MGQEDILNVLRKHKKPLSGAEIAKILGDNDKHVFNSIKRLLKGRYIKIIEIDREQAMRLYKSKRRMRLYYV